MLGFRFADRGAPTALEEDASVETPLSQLLARARARGLLDLTLSNPTRAGLDYSAYGPPGDWLPQDVGLSYSPEPFGSRASREAVCTRWLGGQPAPHPEAVVLCPSSSIAYQYLLTLLCDPGDGVLAPQPSYPLFDALAHYAGVELQRYRLRYDGGWHVDLDSVRRACNRRTRAALIVNPNNPTGSVLSNKELTAMGDLGIPLIVDEVFAAFPLGPDRPRTAFGHSEALTFCIDGLSKSAGLPQVKLSWIALSGPQELVQQALRRIGFIADTYLPVSALADHALPHLLACAPEFRLQLRARLRRNQQQLERALDNSPATALWPSAGWTTLVRLPDVLGAADEDAWIRLLIDQAGFIAHPGYFYDLEGGPHLVLSLLGKPEPFQQATTALRAVVERACRLG